MIMPVTADETVAMTRLTLPRFPALPAELRLSIWQQAIPEEVPELFFYDGRDLSLRGEGPAFPYQCWVDIAFPAMMHTCVEARDVAMRCLAFRRQELGGGSTLQVSHRLLRIDFDIPYLPGENMYRFFRRSLPEPRIFSLPPQIGGQPNNNAAPTWVMPEIRHIAVGATHFLQSSLSLLVHRYLARCPALKTVYVIFNPTPATGSFLSSKARRVHHYRLRDYSMVGLPAYNLSKEERHSYIHDIVAAREKSINAYLDRRLPPGQAHGRNHVKFEAKELFPLLKQDHEWPHWFFD
ncbi:hypothetical protein B0T26DRAFT_700681 [Lasiosphaeria miniovina]|uniref:2EXR domain-containing protein n=1 Tax=Lasiosphaeria miniovina TaxID=1954250 RepID=A0AA40ATV1_9PEZI|nr:uncharacterized protein B0T26DRAFT_700681 [Lasiosphaeria miniovina]KAK0721920.1 hypothetical protein B0T26DRAFT_700681 [Lasiosphaeria miniovina]